jgi:hypothetical protein
MHTGEFALLKRDDVMQAPCWYRKPKALREEFARESNITDVAKEFAAFPFRVTV